VRIKISVYLFLAAIFVYGTGMITVSADSPDLKDAKDGFIERFTAAHAEKDIDAISDLVYWKNVTAEFRALYKDRFIQNFGKKIVSIKIVEADKNEVPTFTQDNVTYVANIEPAGTLKVSFRHEPYTLTLPVGIVEGAYYIAGMSPEFSQYAKTIDAMLNVVAYGYTAAVSVNGIEQISLTNTSESVFLTGNLHRGNNSVKITIGGFGKETAYRKFSVAILGEDKEGEFTRKFYFFSPDTVSVGIYKDIIKIGD